MSRRAVWLCFFVGVVISRFVWPRSVDATWRTLEDAYFGGAALSAHWLINRRSPDA